jgi:hypothetical protein
MHPLSNEPELLLTTLVRLPQKSEIRLGRISTTCGSGWVNRQESKINKNLAYSSSTHPLPQVVLTPVQVRFATFRQSLRRNQKMLRATVSEVTMLAKSTRQLSSVVASRLRVFERRHHTQPVLQSARL